MYKWDAEAYNKNSAWQQSWARELIGKLNLRGDEKILDIGCGEGKVTAEIATYLPSGAVTGIDISEDMVGFAKKTFPIEKHPNLRFLIMDALNLNPDEQFDIVFSNATLHWIKDHRTVLKGIKKHLKPAGRMLVQMAGKGNAGDVMAIMKDACAGKRWGKYFSDFSSPYGMYGPDEYEVWLEEAGLKRSG